MNGIIETSSGDLLRAGFSTFTAGGGETLRTDVPHPAKRRYAANETQMHRWNGSSWVLVANPTRLASDITHGKVTAEKDVLVEKSDSGLCLTSPDASIWRQTIDDNGVATWTKIT